MSSQMNALGVDRFGADERLEPIRGIRDSLAAEGGNPPLIEAHMFRTESGAV